MKLKHGWDVFRQYQKGDLSCVWENLRPDDYQELTAECNRNPADIEAQLMTAADTLMTWETELGPVAVLGVTRTDDPIVGAVWALASTLAEPRWRFAVRHTPALLDELGQNYLVLSNYKDTRNINQIKWLSKVGFTFINEYEALSGLHYLEFVRIMK